MASTPTTVSSSELLSSPASLRMPLLAAGGLVGLSILGVGAVRWSGMPISPPAAPGGSARLEGSGGGTAGSDQEYPGAGINGVAGPDIPWRLARLTRCSRAPDGARLSIAAVPGCAPGTDVTSR